MGLTILISTWIIIQFWRPGSQSKYQNNVYLYASKKANVMVDKEKETYTFCDNHFLKITIIASIFIIHSDTIRGFLPSSPWSPICSSNRILYILCNDRPGRHYIYSLCMKRNTIYRNRTAIVWLMSCHRSSTFWLWVPLDVGNVHPSNISVFNIMLDLQLLPCSQNRLFHIFDRNGLPVSGIMYFM